MTTATERFKALFANTIERLCIVEAELEQTQAQLAELKAAAELSPKAETEKPGE